MRPDIAMAATNIIATQRDVGDATPGPTAEQHDHPQRRPHLDHGSGDGPAEPDDRSSGTSARRELQPDRPAAADRARNLMHGIFTGEIQALEGAGRTTFDFDDEQAPFALKLDMARQCWDESRHVEISVIA